MEAGFDGVQILANYLYLISQFLNAAALRCGITLVIRGSCAVSFPTRSHSFSLSIYSRTYAVPELGNDPTAGSMDGIRDTSPSADLLPGPQARSIGPAKSFRADRGGFGDD